ncbi:MAG: helix-turn-helix domain-containing protein [Pseudomonadota bacterium]
MIDASSDPQDAKGCPVAALMKRLSGEWTTHIIWTLGHEGPTRHGQLRKLVAGISSKVLTDRLRMLEREALVFRDYEPTVPPSVTYGLTERGLKIHAALRSLEEATRDWTWTPETRGEEGPQ